jgi:hypothetical protein
MRHNKWLSRCSATVVVSFISLFATFTHAQQNITNVDATTEVVLIGIAGYGENDSLAGPAHDICALYVLYHTLLGIPASNIHVYFTPDRGNSRRNCLPKDIRAATKASIIEGMNKIRVRLENASMIYLHYTGHGFESSDTQYLVTADRVTEIGNTEKALSVARLLSLIPPRRRFNGLAIFVDACRDTYISNFSGTKGQVQGKTISNDAAVQTLRATGGVFLAASSGELSYTRKSISGARESELMGYFTWAVIRGLVGGARRTDGKISIGSMAAYLEQEVPRSRQYELGMDAIKPQHPKAYLLGNNASTPVNMQQCNGKPAPRI